MRRTTTAMLGAALALTTFVAAGCGGGGSSGDKEGDKTLVVANWKDYGSDMDWVTAEFEKQTGAKVVHQYFNSEDELLQMLRTGGVGKIDVVLPNLAYVQPGKNEGLLQPIDEGKLEHLDALIPELVNSEALVIDGKRYGVPWVWGATSLAYNPETAKGDTNSWSMLWDPANKGKVAFFDDPTTAVMTAALKLGLDPHKPDLDAVRKSLTELKANVRVNWSSADDWTKAYSSGAIVAGNLWSGLAGTQIANGDSIKFVIPAEGGVGWGDSWSLVKDAPHEQLAYDWINFMTSKEFQERWANDKDRSSPAPANMEAQKALTPETRDRIQAHPEWLKELALQTALPPETMQAWTELWQEVKAG